MTTSFSRNRRDFLRNAACASLAAASSNALFSQLRLINSAVAADAGCAAYPPVSDYKALVCVFLSGGNDSYNLLVPSDTSRYATYAGARGAMAIARNQLLPINVANALAGQSYGLHPSCPELASVFDASHGAFVVNTGTVLQRPSTCSLAIRFRRSCFRMPISRRNGNTASRARTERSVGVAW